MIVGCSKFDQKYLKSDLILFWSNPFRPTVYTICIEQMIVGRKKVDQKYLRNDKKNLIEVGQYLSTKNTTEVIFFSTKYIFTYKWYKK